MKPILSENPSTMTLLLQKLCFSKKGHIKYMYLVFITYFTKAELNDG